MGAFASVPPPTLLLSFAATLFVAALFGAWFGKGRSRSLGFALALLALLLGGLFAALTWPLVQGVAPIWSPSVVWTAVVAVGSALLGIGLAVATFVLVVMRA